MRMSSTQDRARPPSAASGVTRDQALFSFREGAAGGYKRGFLYIPVTINI